MDISIRIDQQPQEVPRDIQEPLIQSRPTSPADSDHEFQGPTRDVLRQTSCCGSREDAKSCLGMTMVCGFIGSLVIFAGGWIARACDAPENVSAGMFGVSSTLLTCCCICCCVSQR
jgi:hypothetical protein